MTVWEGWVAEVMVGGAGETMTALDRAGGRSDVTRFDVVVLSMLEDEAGAGNPGRGAEGM
jgi:hypothetical protein